MERKILVVDNEKRMCTLIKQSLEIENYNVQTAYSGNEAFELLQNNFFDVVITDLKMTPVDGLQVLDYVKRNHPSTEVILITAFATQETALEAMKAGAYDYLIKPFKMDELLLRIDRVLKQKEILKENEELKKRHEQPTHLSGIIGKSKKMREVFDLIKRVSKQDAAVLIRGESGTGKELAANAIHSESDRQSKPMVAINCAALPENLLESELFGYEKGAFTGATQSKKGLFEMASGSTLFLDEIGDLSLGLQAKLLRVLQNNEVFHLGGREAIKVDVRLITATHQNLEKMIEEQTFRSDLYYRINLFPIVLPPLRERKEDIPELIEFFMLKHPDKILSPMAKLSLMEYDYPGNIRELENILSREAIISEKIIEEINLPATSFSEESSPKQFGVLPEQGLIIDELLKNLIIQALEKSGGKKSKAAELLGVTRRRLYSMMETHGIEY
ncbi:MAG: sigma-54-dependent Fis family transcriptional regulator [Calditrichaeota bacterium]|nr:MAG: sigma-54-dependent Fis family transcriptional regulator [Calditrichota bacterium]MBL1204124.1 sigma-54-dependent Fis family transcriptional regulator [Calditrichota bacterium]NOG43955.1 sigma-54-dependent Fis family transcriptional regulator [Calditrichota bacterium]